MYIGDKKGCWLSTYMQSEALMASTRIESYSVTLLFF